MYLLYVAVLGLCVVGCPAANRAPKGFSKRRFVFTRIGLCEDQGLGTWTASGKLVKSGKTYLFNGNCTWPIDIDEDVKFRLTAALFKDGQYHDGYLDVIIDGCRQFEHLSNGFLKSFFATTDVEVNECPYPKGTYIFKKFQMESNPILPDSVPNGQYKLTVYVIDKKENILGCTTSDMNINYRK